MQTFFLSFFLSPASFCLSSLGVEGYSFMWSHSHTTTVGRTPLDGGSARHRDLYLTTHNTHNRQKSMPPAIFEPAIPAGDRLQTHALDRSATGIGRYADYCDNVFEIKSNQLFCHICVHAERIFFSFLNGISRCLWLCHKWNTLVRDLPIKHSGKPYVQGGSNMTGTNCDLFTHK